MPTDKKKKQADPDMLGTGMARDAGRAFQNRRQQIDSIVNGTYEQKNRRDPNDKKKPKKGK